MGIKLDEGKKSASVYTSLRQPLASLNHNECGWISYGAKVAFSLIEHYANGLLKSLCLSSCHWSISYVHSLFQLLWSKFLKLFLFRFKLLVHSYIRIRGGGESLGHTREVEVS